MTEDRVEVAASLNALFEQHGSPLSVRPTSYGGLGVFATRRIRAGEAVLHERPLLLTVSRSSEATACARCLSVCEPGGEWSRTCAGCGRLRYCSDECQASHEEHDDVECAALAADDAADDDVGDLVAQAIAALALRARDGSVDVLPGVVAGYDAYAKRLCGIRRTQRNGAHVKRAVLAALKAVTPAARVPPKELFDVLDRHQANVYGVLGPGNEDVALASFVGAFHLFNHSCLPNLVFDCRPRPVPPGHARGPCFALVALVDVKPGVELVHCYASSADGPTARRSYLHHHHGFACACRRCQCDDLDLEARLTGRLERVRCRSNSCGSGLSYVVYAGSDPRRRCVHCGGVWEEDEEEEEEEDDDEDDDDDDSGSGSDDEAGAHSDACTSACPPPSAPPSPPQMPAPPPPRPSTPAEAEGCDPRGAVSSRGQGDGRRLPLGRMLAQRGAKLSRGPGVADAMGAPASTDHARSTTPPLHGAPRGNDGAGEGGEGAGEGGEGGEGSDGAEGAMSLEALLLEASLTHLHPTLLDKGGSLEELQSIRLHQGRPALLRRLADLGVSRLPDRQRLAQVLGKASRAGRVPTALRAPTRPTDTPPLPPSSGKLAFLFLIYESIEHERLWQAFLEGAEAGEAQFSLHVHAKSRTKPLAPRFEGAHLAEHEVVPTEYGHVSLIHAQLALLRHALRDPANRKFVFLSGACIPVKPFWLVYEQLLSDDRAHFSQMDMSTTSDAGIRRQVVEACEAWIDRRCVAKASQWFVLNRRLATLCASLPASRIGCFDRVRAPEEWMFLSVARQEGDEDVRAVVDDACNNHTGPTFANWNEKEQSPEGHRPRTYREVNIDELYALVHGPCWFARKFAAGCNGLAQLEHLLAAGSSPAAGPAP